MSSPAFEIRSLKRVFNSSTELFCCRIDFKCRIAVVLLPGLAKLVFRALAKLAHCWNYHLVILMTTHVAGTCIQLPPFPNPPHPFPICTVLLMISHACLVSDSADSCI